MAMMKHIDAKRALLAAGLVSGLSAACMSNPVAGTSEPDARLDVTSPVPDAAVRTSDSFPLTSDAYLAACGNGRLDPGETCDDGNGDARDGCSASCTLEPGGVCPEPGESCTIRPFCGDGYVTGGEQCDLGNNDGRYGGCRSDCTFGPYCGDGVVQVPYEQCDLGNNDGRYRGCNPDCTVSPYCGDGVVQADSEQCDDGNNSNGDGCGSTCQCENSTCGNPRPVCGDGKVDSASGEACDDGNALNDDGCSSTCQVEPCYWTECGCNGPCGDTIPVCGDGLVRGAETCDDGNAMPGDGCSGTCQVEPDWYCAAPGRPCQNVPVCGNGKLDSGEECDLGGNDGSYGGCTSACKLGPHCGDGIVQANYENCDDGNSQSGDGCSNACRLEPNY
jgi:large repetitive protein